MKFSWPCLLVWMYIAAVITGIVCIGSGYSKEYGIKPRNLSHQQVVGYSLPEEYTAHPHDSSLRHKAFKIEVNTSDGKGHRCHIPHEDITPEKIERVKREYPVGSKMTIAYYLQDNKMTHPTQCEEYTLEMKRTAEAGFFLLAGCGVIFVVILLLIIYENTKLPCYRAYDSGKQFLGKMVSDFFTAVSTSVSDFCTVVTGFPQHALAVVMIRSSSQTQPVSPPTIQDGDDVEMVAVTLVPEKDRPTLSNDGCSLCRVGRVLS